MLISTVNTSTEVLNSWKEIATYLDRGVRTVQRWETELGLPVRRPRGRGRSAVIAMRSEIDLWLKSCPLEKWQEHAQIDDPAVVVEPIAISNQELLATSRRLRGDVRTSRRQVSNALAELVKSLDKMAKGCLGVAPAVVFTYGAPPGNAPSVA